MTNSGRNRFEVCFFWIFTLILYLILVLFRFCLLRVFFFWHVSKIGISASFLFCNFRVRAKIDGWTRLQCCLVILCTIRDASRSPNQSHNHTVFCPKKRRPVNLTPWCHWSHNILIVYNTHWAKTRQPSDKLREYDVIGRRSKEDPCDQIHFIIGPKFSHTHGGFMQIAAMAFDVLSIKILQNKWKCNFSPEVFLALCMHARNVLMPLQDVFYCFVVVFTALR